MHPPCRDSGGDIVLLFPTRVSNGPIMAADGKAAGGEVEQRVNSHNGLPGFLTSTTTRSLCLHFELRCPRMHGSLVKRQLSQFFEAE
jgi:hypothetical protein